MVVAIVIGLTLAVLFVILVRSGEAAPVRQGSRTSNDHALQVAREQFASGAIDAVQYERIASALRR